MRLLHTKSVQMVEFVDGNIPAYVILSHTWEEEEVSFQDMRDESRFSKKGYQKLDSCCKQAVKNGYEYVWIDTCCIDKTSSAELSEAINSMFRWYRLADKCYAYLSDLPSYLPHVAQRNMDLVFPTCKWFGRGWTLQELLAPREVVFFSQDWKEL